MVSDNATIFTSDPFKNFCNENGIFQKFIAPGHPATNGLAERNVQTLKHKLKTMITEPLTLQEKVREIMFRYRATPLANGKTPAEMYLKRTIRISLGTIRPFKDPGNQEIIPKTRKLSVGDRVQTKTLEYNKPVWRNGTILQKYGQLHYKVKLDNGYEFKRHIDQLRKTEIKKKVSFDCKNNNELKQTLYEPDLQHFEPRLSDQPEITEPDENVPPEQPEMVGQPDEDGQPAVLDVPIRRSGRERREPICLQDFHVSLK